METESKSSCGPGRKLVIAEHCKQKKVLLYSTVLLYSSRGRLVHCRRVTGSIYNAWQKSYSTVLELARLLYMRCLCWGGAPSRVPFLVAAS